MAIWLLAQQDCHLPVRLRASGEWRVMINGRPDERMPEMRSCSVYHDQAEFLGWREHRRVETWCDAGYDSAVSRASAARGY